ncbi:MAG: hypothetical protein JXE06_02465, partial [Coriobacteriia bacterium]|nr:hypothetical protein [Coriobacteriia bacterium]
LHGHMRTSCRDPISAHSSLTPAIDADNLVQEGREIIIRRLPDIAASDDPLASIYTVARQRMIDVVRASNRRIHDE